MLRRAFDRGYVIALVALVVYAWLASPHIVGNDNAEFSILSVSGGIAHPSGYPLYTLWLRAWSWLPGSTPAHTAALATIPIAVASLLALHAACRAWGARPLAAHVAVIAFATSSLMLRVNTEAEVFPINNLVVALVLWLSAANGPLRGVKRSVILGVVAGLGLANNLSCALVAPVGLLGVIRGARESRIQTAIPAAIAGLLVGLLPYLYLFVAPTSIASWSHPSSVGDLFDIMTRKQYGGAFGFAGSDDEVHVGAQLAELAVTLARMWRWVLLPVGIIALGYRVWRPDGEPRSGWIALAACFLLAGPILVMRFDIPPVRMGLYVIHRFHVLPALFLVIPVASGLDALARRTNVGTRSQVRPAVVDGFAILGFIGLLVTSLPELSRFHSPAMENGIRGFLAGVPRDAIVLTFTDEFDTGFHYEQIARHERPDVLVFRPHVLHLPWYADDIRALGFDVRETDTTLDITAKALATGRPVFVNHVDKKIVATQFSTYPFGQFDRVLPPGTSMPALESIVDENKQLYAHFDIAYPRPGPEDEFATGMHVWLAAPWQRLASAFTQRGQRAQADECYAIAAQLVPED